jgi:TATA-box binding protein (TBP) (component of TFIID and TFIIIB)
MGRILINKVEKCFPDFDDYKPSMITILVLLNRPQSDNTRLIDLEKVYENLFVLEHMTVSLENSLPRNKKLKFPLIEEEGIISLRLSDPYFISYHPNNGTRSWVQKGMPGGCPFSYSLAIDYSFGKKNIAVKVFHTGKILLTGIRNEQEAVFFSRNLFSALQECGAIEPGTTMEAIEPQTNNFSISCGFMLNIPRLGEILQQSGFLSGYDNLSSHAKITMDFPSQISKSHLKSKTKPEFHIQIYRSGQILQNGPDVDEMRETYERLTSIMSCYIDEIKMQYRNEVDRQACFDEFILDLFSSEDSLYSSKELSKNTKTKKAIINQSIRRLFKDGKIELVADDCYKRIFC